MYWIVTSPKDQLLAGQETGTIGFDAEEPVQQNMAQGDFVIVFSSFETTSGRPLDAFTALGRTAGTPLETPEGPWTINRRIAYFSTIDLPLTNIHEELVYPEDLPQWREKTLFQVGADDFLAIAEAMLPPPVFQKVQSVAEHRLL